MPKAKVKGNVIPFKRRKRALTPARALAVLREKELVAVPSITALAEMLGWSRTRASRALARWQKAGLIAVERHNNGRITIRALPVDPVRLREFGPGENRERPRRRKRAGGSSKRRAEPRVRTRVRPAEERASERADEHENERAIPASVHRAFERAVERAISPENRGTPIVYENKPTPGNALNTASSEASSIPPPSGTEIPPENKPTEPAQVPADPASFSSPQGDTMTTTLDHPPAGERLPGAGGLRCLNAISPRGFGTS